MSFSTWLGVPGGSLQPACGILKYVTELCEYALNFLRYFSQSQQTRFETPILTGVGKGCQIFPVTHIFPSELIILIVVRT